MDYKNYIEDLKKENKKSVEAIKYEQKNSEQIKLNKKNDKKNKILEKKHAYKKMKEDVKKGNFPESWINLCDEIVKDCSQKIKKGENYAIFHLSSSHKLSDCMYQYADIFKDFALKYFKKIGFKVNITLKRVLVKRVTTESFDADLYSNKSDYSIVKSRDKYDHGWHLVIVLGIKNGISALEYLKENVNSLIGSHYYDNSSSSIGTYGRTTTITHTYYYFKKWKMENN